MSDALLLAEYLDGGIPFPDAFSEAGENASIKCAATELRRLDALVKEQAQEIERLRKATRQAASALHTHAMLPWGTPDYPSPTPGWDLLCEARSYLGDSKAQRVPQVAPATKAQFYVRVSNISGLPSGVFPPNADGSAPDVELKSESLVPVVSAQRVPLTDGTFWLIERGPNQRQVPHVWWMKLVQKEPFTVVGSYDWTTDATKATRFTSKQEAQAAAEAHYLQNYAITGHMLINEDPLQRLDNTDKAPEPKFKLGDYVRKKSGSAWSGRVVGTYSTTLTPEGYAVESDAHPGSVQIYPAAALETGDGITDPLQRPEDLSKALGEKP